MLQYVWEVKNSLWKAFHSQKIIFSTKKNKIPDIYVKKFFSSDNEVWEKCVIQLNSFNAFSSFFFKSHNESNKRSGSFKIEIF